MDESNRSGILPGPQLLGNRGEDVFQLPDGTEGTIHQERVAFCYTFVHGRLHVYTDLDSDIAIVRVWTVRNPVKALSKATKTLERYGDTVDLDTLLADGWAVVGEDRSNTTDGSV